jgi:hypothetical protein
MAAYDTDGDDQTDQWVVVLAAETICQVWKWTGKWDVYEFVGECRMPATMTFDLAD